MRINGNVNSFSEVSSSLSYFHSKAKERIAKDCKTKCEIEHYNCHEVDHISRESSKPKIVPKAQVNLIEQKKKE